MILQLINIVSGATLSVPQIKEVATPYVTWIGVLAFAVGILGLIERLLPLTFGLPLGASFPQAIPAILVGLLLAGPRVHVIPYGTDIQKALSPYATWIGYTAMASGVGSLLFGCVLPYVCMAPFGI